MQVHGKPEGNTFLDKCMIKKTGVLTNAFSIKHGIADVKCIFPIASVVQWSQFLATDPEVQGSIPGTTRVTENMRVWKGAY
jgi:hypothetical protein